MFSPSHDCRQVTIQQLLREWPPGFGGIERVAHELASSFGGEVFSLDVQRDSSKPQDPLHVRYIRIRLRSFGLFGRLFLPLPCRALFKLLLSPDPLHGHLPCPGVLLLLFLARIVQPKRHVSAHWHSFLDRGSGFNGFLVSVYQKIALRLVPYLSAVVTTSPCLASELQHAGVSEPRIFLLPCCLSKKQEHLALSLPFPPMRADKALRILFIGRLDSYKRLDWLFEALNQITSPWYLVVVGDGPKRSRFERLAQTIFPQSSRVRFLGRLSEASKFEQLAAADVLVLPSDCCNEAFGIVQLEAMAAGRVSLAFDQPRSGMGWVSKLSGLPWSQSREGLPEVLERLAKDPVLRRQSCLQARQRYSELFARGVWMQELQRFRALVEGGMVNLSVE